MAAPAKRAQRIGWCAGRPVYRVPVYAVTPVPDNYEEPLIIHEDVVLAHTATEAARWFLRHINQPNTHVVARGPKGGRITRFMSQQEHHTSSYAFQWGYRQRLLPQMQEG